jgi:hypothetical protein
MQKRHLNQIELSRRWNISHRTLERWRSTSDGPPYLKLGGRVLYRHEDVEAFEETRLRRARLVSDAVEKRVVRPHSACGGGR